MSILAFFTSKKRMKRKERELLAILALIVLSLGSIVFGIEPTYSFEPAVDSANVTTVVDGDTLKVSLGGKDETIRLVGIDTPETKAPGVPVQCFGPEASAKTAELVAGKEIRLEYDETQGERDRYQRILAYVYFSADGSEIMLNEYLVRTGYAKVYTKAKSDKQVALLAAESLAQQEGLGLWSACANEPM